MRAEDEPDVSKMNVSDGGANRGVTRDTIWKGQVQQIGSKGLKTVLMERKMIDKNAVALVNDTGKLGQKLLKDDMAELLKTCSDFADTMTRLERLFADRGHLAMFLPKFHPGLHYLKKIKKR